MRIHTGTSGFSYPEWKGSFYPQKIAAKNMLQFYAGQLSTVEINNTFYRMPRRSVIEGWTSQVAGDFLFAVKVSRRITHFKKLADTAELLDFFVQGLAAFGATLGPVLIQCPPTLQADAQLLTGFLADLQTAVAQHFPAGTQLRLAFEFRHKSWWVDEIYHILAAHHACLVSGDLDEAEKDPPLVKTGSHIYLRLRKTNYEPGDLENWASRLLALGVDESFVYFKHEVLGPKLAADLSSLIKTQV